MEGRIFFLLSILCCSTGCSTVTTVPDATASVVNQTKAMSQVVDAKSAVVVGVDGTQSIFNCAADREIRYVPLPAMPAFGYTKIKVEQKGKFSAPIQEEWPDKAEDVNALLTNIATNIAEDTFEVSGSVGGIFGASTNRKQYTIDFMKWRGEPLFSSDGKNQFIGWARVGAGLRLVVRISKNDGSASGSLLALAFSAKTGKVEGSISTELIGIDAKEVTQAVPFTVDLTEGNIQKIIEALAIVKSKLYDSTTKLRPNLIARIECGVQVTTAR